MSWPNGVVVREGEPLARHLPWRVGGRCDAYIVVHRVGALADAVAACREAGWSRMVLGAGTRTVVRDGGLAGAVIRLGLDFCRIEPTEGGTWIGAATPLARVAPLLGPAGERLRFAPGTVGGSVVNDAGWEPWVDRVRVVGRGAEKEVALADGGPWGSTILTAIRLRVGVDARPPHVPVVQGWFTGPHDADPTPAIREATLAGTRLRGVLLPTSAPAMLVNLGEATARDLQLLQRSVVERVQAQRGVALADRMTWLGRPS